MPTTRATASSPATRSSTSSTSSPPARSPGEQNEAEPQEGGKKPLPGKPAGDMEVNPEGVLAETGADSHLPVIATVGGAAVLAGTGVMFALKRRRSTTAT